MPLPPNIKRERGVQTLPNGTAGRELKRGEGVKNHWKAIEATVKSHFSSVEQQISLCLAFRCLLLTFKCY